MEAVTMYIRLAYKTGLKVTGGGIVGKSYPVILKCHFCLTLELML